MNHLERDRLFHACFTTQAGARVLEWLVEHYQEQRMWRQDPIDMAARAAEHDMVTDIKRRIEIGGRADGNTD